MNEQPKVVRRRNWHDDNAARPVMAHVRMSRAVSGELNSMLGLCWKYGKRETIAELFERVAMPALRVHVKPYADKARAERGAV